MPRQLTRRHFLVTSSAVVAASSSVASRSLAASANGKLRTAHVGVGGMGRADLNSVSSHARVEVAGLCDVDSKRLAEASKSHPGAKTFKDYREMIDALGESVDAIVVSTPDHTHAPAAMTALNAGKPVYCQKPLTHEVFEARQLRLVAEKKGLVTQMGIQVHSAAPYRRAVAIIQSGAIGKVSQVHAWSNKNWGYDGKALPPASQAPANLDFNLWLGTSSETPYVSGVYHPGAWRKLIPYGTGTLGDMGVHIFDTPYDALALTAPLWAKTTCRMPTGVGHPSKNTVEYEFPGTKFTTDTMRWTWYDGGFAPPRELPQLAKAGIELGKDLKLPGQGALFIGEEGVMLLPHVGEPQLLPSKKFADLERPKVPAANHYHQWVDACMGEGETSASFSYAGPLTEALLLGVVANRFPGQKLNWDAENLKITNLEEANDLLKREYREGFEVDGL